MIYYQDRYIIIRDVCYKDCTYLFTWDIDEEINAHDPRPLPKNTIELLNECSHFCSRFENEIFNEDISLRKYKYFIVTNINNKPIGFINFFSFDSHKRQCEMGVIIGDTRYWRQGIAYKAIPIIMQYVFENMDINRIYIETGSNNLPALKLFEKISFTRCGEYLEDNNFEFIVMEYVK